MKRGLPEPDASFAEKIGLYFERQGAPRIAGKIMGALLVADGPLSFEQLAAALHVSKASISTNVKMFERTGMIERRSIPGDRRHYVEMTEATWEHYFVRATQNTLTFGALCAEVLEILPASRKHARARLVAGVRVMRLMEKQFQAAFVEWRRQRAVPARKGKKT